MSFNVVLADEDDDGEASRPAPRPPTREPQRDIPSEKADTLIHRIQTAESIAALADLEADPDVVKGRNWFRDNRPELEKKIQAARWRLRLQRAMRQRRPIRARRRPQE